MNRVAVRGLTSEKTEVIQLLHDAGVMHIISPEEVPAPGKELNDLKLLGGKLLGLLEALQWRDWGSLTDAAIEEQRKKTPLFTDTVILEINNSLDQFSRRLTAQRHERKRLIGEIASLRKSLRVSSHFDSFCRDESGKGRAVSLWWIYDDNHADVLEEIRKLIRSDSRSRKSEYFRYHLARVEGEEPVLSISLDGYFEEPVFEIMTQLNAALWKPPAGIPRLPMSGAISSMEALLDEYPAIIESLDLEIARAKTEWGPKLAILFLMLDEKLEQNLTEGTSVDKGEMFCIEGWIPSDELPLLAAAMKNGFNERVLVSWRFPLSEEWRNVPTALANPPVFRPFELFLKLQPVLRYKSIDPTIVIGIFFPFFCGCMVGDVGYGAIIALAGFALSRSGSKPVLRDVGVILLFMGAWSLAWGAVFGEMFGDMGHRLFHMEPLWVERSQAVIPVMVLSVAIGFAHVSIGLLLGLYQGLKNRDRHMWMERLGNLAVLAGLLVGLITLRDLLPDAFFTVSVTIMVIGLMLLIGGGGMGGLVESFGSVGNILSYVRIAAIGLSSAILAIVASRFVDLLGVSFLGVMLALGIHMLNFVLAIGGSGLHSARLQYVEFMGKFYTGGGTAYRPFSRRKEQSWKKR